MGEDGAGDIIVEVDEHGVMLVTFNRPERMNALSGPMLAGLREAIERASSDDAVRALVLTGNGRAFCAGAEITAAGDPSRGGGGASRYAKQDHLGAAGRMVQAFNDCDVPVIGAINGAAVGGGFGLALNCDIRFAAESARLGSIFIRRGLAADYGASYWLPRIVGVSRALELFYDGSPVPARRALELGLVQRVVPDEALLDETLAYARRIAAGPPMAYTYIRRLALRSLDMGQREFLELEWGSQSHLLGTADAREGFQSFLEQREPRFTGE